MQLLFFTAGTVRLLVLHVWYSTVILKLQLFNVVPPLARYLRFHSHQRRIHPRSAALCIYRQIKETALTRKLRILNLSIHLTVDLSPDPIPDLNVNLMPHLSMHQILYLTVDLSPDLTRDLSLDLIPDPKLDV